MSRRGWVLFIALGIIWGTPYMLIKVAVGELSPASVAFARTAIGAVALLPLATRRGQLRVLRPHWRALLAFTTVEVCLPLLLLAYAEQDLSSSLTGLLLAAVPLIGALLVWAVGHESISGRRLAGLVAGFAGVAALVGFDVEASSPLPVIAVGITAIGYAAGPLILGRQLAGLPGLGIMATSSVIAAVIYAPAGIVQWPADSPSGQVWLSVLGLGIGCTAVAYVVQYALVQEVGPARATVITYVNPAVALLLGVLVLSERITMITVIGFALILAGSFLATSRDRPASPAAWTDVPRGESSGLGRPGGIRERSNRIGTTRRRRIPDPFEPDRNDARIRVTRRHRRKPDRWL